MHVYIVQLANTSLARDTQVGGVQLDVCLIPNCYGALDVAIIY